jgi:hypothetical protein
MALQERLICSSEALVAVVAPGIVRAVGVAVAMLL